jgi:cyclic beta-1,2-glucan synthetase
MQRAGIESILGLLVEGRHLHLDPCIPTFWPGFTMTLRYGSASYEITVENPDGVASGVVWAMCDGNIITERPLRLPLVDDGGRHAVQVKLG